MGVIARMANRVRAAFEKRPDGTVHAADFAAPLATRTWRELTPERALMALQAAQQGSIRAAADFCDQLLTDDRVAGVLDTRTLGMLGLPLYFEGPELPEWWDLVQEGELASFLQWGLLLGVSFARIEADGSLRFWHPRDFDFNRQEQQWYVTTSEGREPLDPNEWVVYEPYGSGDSALRGLWISLSLPVLVKLFSLHDRARASEVFGSAMVIGKAPEGATEDQRRGWLADLKSLARSTRMVLPDLYDIKLLEPQGQTWGIYQNSIEWADNAITIRIAGQLVTTTGTTGFNRGDVHQAIARSLLKFGEQTLSSCLAKQYVPRVWAAMSAPRWQTASPDELIGEGSAMKSLADGMTALESVLAPTNVALDVPAYMRRFGILTQPKPSASLGLTLVAAREPMQRARLTASILPSEPPKEFRIFKMGANKSAYGTVYYTRESAIAIMRERGNRDVMIDLEHLSLDPDAPNFDPNARGWSRLQCRPNGLWAVRVRWTAEGSGRITRREQRSISPVFGYRTKDKVILSLHNLALTAMPATHDGVVLIAASQKGKKMEKLLQLLGLPPEATLDDVIAALGLDASATAADVLAALAAAFEAGAEGEEEAATEGEEEAATEGEEEEEAATEGEEEAATAKPTKTAAATSKLKKPASVSDTAARLARLEKADEDRERASLIASVTVTPREKTLLLSASLKDVRAFVASATKKPPKVQSPKSGEDTQQIAASAIEAVAKATGLPKSKVTSLVNSKGV